MKKLFLMLAIILITAATAAAQQKTKSLTMEDVQPAAPRTSETESANANTAPRSEQERSWQARMNDAEMKMFNAQLRVALEERNADAQLELRQRQNAITELSAQGAKQG